MLHCFVDMYVFYILHHKSPKPHMCFIHICFVHIYIRKTLNATCSLLYRYVKEGSTVTVLGVVQRHDNVLMIVPPRASISTGCLWSKLGFPKTVDGLIISCEEEECQNDGVPL